MSKKKNEVGEKENCMGSGFVGYSVTFPEVLNKNKTFVKGFGFISLQIGSNAWLG